MRQRLKNNRQIVRDFAWRHDNSPRDAIEIGSTDRRTICKLFHLLWLLSLTVQGLLPIDLALFWAFPKIFVSLWAILR
ncbi:hypothetical protein Plhal304r1_c079g0165391 [Plasmopara halstedii]